MSGPSLLSRRQILRGRTSAPPPRPRPPGVSAASLSACTACGRCVDACPERVLVAGPDGVAFDAGRGECTFCGTCAEVCPEPVFAAPLVMAHVARIGDACLVQAGVACMTCRDACPEAAIAMRPRRGGPFLPDLDPAACTGCGACVAPCPAGAIHLSPEAETRDA